MDVNPSPMALHGEATTIQPHPRPITIEDNVMNQIDRIGYLRSTGQSWVEPVFHLRDLIVGLEDEEFWTGLPMNLGKDKLNALTPEQKQQYSERGWNTMRVQERVVKQGTRVIKFLDPTPSELSLMLRIMMALMARRNMTWRRRNVDEIPMTFLDKPGGTGLV